MARRIGTGMAWGMGCSSRGTGRTGDDAQDLRARSVESVVEGATDPGDLHGMIDIA